MQLTALPTSFAQVENVWRYTSIRPYIVMECCLSTESFVFTLTTVTGVWCGAGVVGESRDDLPGLEAVVYFQVLSRHFMDRPRKTTKYLTILRRLLALEANHTTTPVRSS